MVALLVLAAGEMQPHVHGVVLPLVRVVARSLILNDSNILAQI